jgi:hypothetical protein
LILYAKVTNLQHFLMIFSARKTFYACSVGFRFVPWYMGHQQVGDMFIIVKRASELRRGSVGAFWG